MSNSLWLIFFSTLILAGCNQPPTPMPYESTATEKIEVVDVDYDVSRFWSCSWAGACPRKTWRYCLNITPLTDEAAVQWYGIYNQEHLERARRDIKGIARGTIRELPIPPIQTHASDGRPYEPYEIEEQKERRAVLERIERFRHEVQLYDGGDPTFRQKIIDQMKSGFRMEAYFIVAGSGSERNVSGWGLTPGC